MKLLLNPPSETDIDVMISNHGDRERAVKMLESEFGPASNGGILEGPHRKVFRLDGLDIDIYPDASWGGLKVADGDEIISRSTLESFAGNKLRLPAPDDSFYLIATHAYSHLNIRSVELENCLCLISGSGFSWGRIRKLVSEFGMKKPVQFFVEALIAMRAGKISSWRVLTSFHTHKLIGKIGRRELTSDFLWHFVRPISKSLGVR